ncbi:MAG: DMT family transporter, partial [Pseudomonadota bacterium]
MPRAATAGDWIALLVLTAFWGSSFAFTQIALASFPPAVLVFSRVVIAAFVLLVYLRGAGVRLPATARDWVPMGITAVFGNLLPFHLIAWAQQHIDSSTAAILMAMNPLFVLTLAHFLVPGARLNASRIAGFGVGFVGVLLVVGPGHGDDLGSNVTLAGSLAAVGAAMSYAINSVYARRLGPVNPVQLSAGMLIASSLLSLPTALIDTPAIAHVTPSTAAAVGFLGLLSTGVASLLYFRIIQGPGPAFLSLISYLV